MADSMTFKVCGGYGDPKTTRINLVDVPGPQVWNEVDEVLRKRFGDRLKSVNHTGRTVTLEGYEA